jgi:general secretion pathway protein N
VAALSLDQLSSTREHPLFAPTRRLPPPPPPPVARAPDPPPPPPPPPSVTLVGIVMDGVEARAVVRGAAAQEIRVQIGDDIGGWKVSQIEGRKLVLSSLDGRLATFTMFNTDNGKGTPKGSPSANAQTPQTQSGQPPPGVPAAKVRRQRR